MRKNVILWVGIFALLILGSEASFAQDCKGKIGFEEGNCAPEVTITTLSGRKVQLSDLRGKVVFLNFWATWCQPCVAEMPTMERAYQQLKGKKFEMLAVSLDDTEEKIRSFFSKDQQLDIHFDLATNPNMTISQAFGSEKVPETFVIDKTGRIRDKILGFRFEWYESLIVHYFQLLMKE
ncbi:MAG: TlpA disulfide reductase family protein [Bdellovibrionota bacterium]